MVGRLFYVALATALLSQVVAFVPSCRLPSSHTRVARTQRPSSRRSPITPTNTNERAITIKPLHADLGKIMSDDIYRPMFLQAIFLSISGVVAAFVLGTIIAMKGPELQKALVEEAYQERDQLKSRLNTKEQEDGTVMIGFKDETDASSDAAVAKETEAPAPKEQPKPRELVGVSSGAVDDDFED